MKKIIVVLLSIFLIIGSVSITCFASGKIEVGTNNGNGSNNVVIKDDPEITKTTTFETTDKVIPQTDPVTTNVHQYVESIKKTTNPSSNPSDVVSDEEKTTNNTSNVATTSIKNKKVYMNATFVSEVPEDVSGDIQISVYNKDTGDSFNFTLPKNNRFFLMVELPVGNYVYTKIVIPNNEDNRFVAQYTSFFIGYVMNSIVNFEVIDTQATKPQTENVITEEITSEVITTEDIDIVVEPEKKEESKFKTIIIPIAILILIVAIYIFKKYNKKNIENENSQNDIQNYTNRF